MDCYGNNNGWTEHDTITPPGWSFGNGIIGQDFMTNSELHTLHDHKHVLSIYNEIDKNLHSNLINNPFSVSLWFNCTSWCSLLESAGIIMWGQSQTDISMSLDIYGGIPSLGYLALKFNNIYFFNNFDSPEASNCLVSYKYYIGTSWHHIVMTYDGKMMFLYIDNVLEDSKERVSIKEVNSISLGIGSFYYFPGEIDELYFYNVCLTNYEISQLYNIEIGDNPELPTSLKFDYLNN